MVKEARIKIKVNKRIKTTRQEVTNRVAVTAEEEAEEAVAEEEEAEAVDVAEEERMPMKNRYPSMCAVYSVTAGIMSVLARECRKKNEIGLLHNILWKRKPRSTVRSTASTVAIIPVEDNSPVTQGVKKLVSQKGRFHLPHQ